MKNCLAGGIKRMSAKRKYERTNERFYYLLHDQQELTTAMLAALADTGRAHLTQVLNNKPGRGKETRVKLAGLCWTVPHPQAGHYILTDEMLKELGWNRDGTFHVEQSAARTGK